MLLCDGFFGKVSFYRLYRQKIKGFLKFEYSSSECAKTKTFILNKIFRTFGITVSEKSPTKCIDHRHV